MHPISFTCHETLGHSPAEVVARILDLANWSEFEGYAFLPGIQTAEFEVRTPQTVGTRIRVTNTDGSSHVEEIVAWQPDRRLTLHMQEFSPPVSRLATRFDETWHFESSATGTRVSREFHLHARSTFTWPLLWLISRVLKRAITRHLRQLRDSAQTVN